MSNPKILFLDDCPNRQKAFRSAVPFAKIVATSMDAIAAMKGEAFDMVFLDHDLGGEVFVDSSREDCGMEVVRFMEEHKPSAGRVVVHTMNPAAGQQMEQALVAAGYWTRRAAFGSERFQSYVAYVPYLEGEV